SWQPPTMNSPNRRGCARPRISRKASRPPRNAASPISRDGDPRPRGTKAERWIVAASAAEMVIPRRAWARGAASTLSFRGAPPVRAKRGPMREPGIHSHDGRRSRHGGPSFAQHQRSWLWFPRCAIAHLRPAPRGASRNDERERAWSARLANHRAASLLCFGRRDIFVPRCTTRFAAKLRSYYWTLRLKQLV